MKHLPACIAALLLAITACPLNSRAQSSLIGGYAATSVTNAEVVAAANFAIKAQQIALNETAKKEPPKLELVTLMQAEQQVVAGVNYRLLLKVKTNGKEQMAEAIVWWQAWRKPDPYQLTSWKWK